MKTPAPTLGALCLARGLGEGALEAVSDGSTSLTYGELAEAAGAAARRLRAHGVRPGDRVALQGPNTVPWVVAAFGILLAGASVVPLGHHLPAAARQRLLDRVPVRLLVHPEAFLSTAERDPDAGTTPEAVPTDPGAEALVLLSSGTTGEPKVVAMTHRQLLRVYTEVTDRLGVSVGDRMLGVVPLAHSFGFNGVLLVSVLAGAMVRLVPSYDRNALAELVSRERLGVISGPPTLLRDLVADRSQCPALAEVVDLVVTGSAEVSVEELSGISRRLGGSRVVVGYGMSETCGTVALGESGLGESGPGESGPGESGPDAHAWLRPLSGTEVRVRPLDESAPGPGVQGVLMVRGHNVSPPLDGAVWLDEEGWFDTEDLGVMDERGRIAVVGRADDRITVAGFSVHPAAVERALLEHPSVHAAAVVGVPDPRRGMRLVACVVPTGHLDRGGLRRFLGERLAPHELPSEYVALDALPATHTGKTSRREVLRRLDEGNARPYG